MLVQGVSGYTLSYHPASSAARTVLVAPGDPGVVKAAPGQKNRKVLPLLFLEF